MIHSFIAFLSSYIRPEPYPSFPPSSSHESHSSLARREPSYTPQCIPLLPAKTCRQEWFPCVRCQACPCSDPESLHLHATGRRHWCKPERCISREAGWSAWSSN